MTLEARLAMQKLFSRKNATLQCRMRIASWHAEAADAGTNLHKSRSN